MSSDLLGVNPATLNGILLYYRLMTKRSGLGDSTELSRVGLSQYKYPAPQKLAVGVKTQNLRKNPGYSGLPKTSRCKLQ
jgi:hypothetical protein